MAAAPTLMVSCGEFYKFETLVKSLIRKDSARTFDNCWGLAIVERTFKDCTVLSCGSDDDWKKLFMKAITMVGGKPALNVVLATPDLLEDDCNVADWSAERKMKSIFCEDSDGQVAVLLYVVTDSPT